MSNDFQKELGSTFGIVIAVTVIFAVAIVGTFLAIAAAIAGACYGAYWLYVRYGLPPPPTEAEKSALLYDEVRAKNPRTIDRDAFAELVGRHIRGLLPESVGECAKRIAMAIYEQENFGVTVPPPPATNDSIELARYRDRLARVVSVGDTELRQAAEVIGRAFYNCLDDLPAIEEGESDIAVPLATFFPDVADSIEYLIFPFFADDAKQFFPRTRADFDRIYNEQKAVLPTKYKGDDVVRAYLRGTPFERLFALPIRLSVPKAVTYEHTVITAGTGHGKTTLLSNMILRDIEDYDCPSVVVIDSQNQLIPKLARVALAQRRRLIVIDPKDSPALNVFDLNTARIARYGEAEREQIQNHTLETFGYLFDALLGADLTVRQGTLFNYIITLMLAMPQSMGRNATLLDLIRLTESPQNYAQAMERLNPVAKEFFRKDFMERQYAQTKEQIRYRLHAILGNPTLARLFLAPKNTIDFYEELANGAIILIDTDKNYLGAKNSSYLGRIALTIILQSILERGANRIDHTPAHIYIDEAGEYFDRSIDTFLTEARKHRCGITFAHQHLGQLTPELRGSIAANTSTKYAGGVSAQDARALASDMRTEPQFLMAQSRLSFACFVRNVTPHAVSVPVKLGALDDADQVSEAQYQTFRAQNRDWLRAPELADNPQPTEEEAGEGETTPETAPAATATKATAPSRATRKKSPESEEDLRY